MISIQPNQLAGLNVLYGSTYTASTRSHGTQPPRVQISGEYFRFGAQIQTDFRQTIDTQHAVFRFNPLNDADPPNLTYGQRPDLDLSPAAAKELTGPDGYFGVDQTSQRIADFVLNGAQDDIELLKAGREGILKGFDEAESYDTLEKSLAAIDEKIGSLGEPIVDISA